MAEKTITVGDTSITKPVHERRVIQSVDTTYLMYCTICPWAQYGLYDYQLENAWGLHLNALENPTF